MLDKETIIAEASSRAGKNANLKDKRDQEKQLIKELATEFSGPERVRVKYFMLTGPAKQIDDYIKFMQRKDVVFTSLKYDLKQITVGDTGEVGWIYSAMITYTELPVSRYSETDTDFELHVFTLPYHEEQLGDFLTYLGDPLPKEALRVIYKTKMSNVIQMDTMNESDGSTTLFYHIRNTYTRITGAKKYDPASKNSKS